MDEPRPLPLSDDFAYADAADAVWTDASARFTHALVAGKAILLDAPEDGMDEPAAPRTEAGQRLLAINYAPPYTGMFRPAMVREILAIEAEAGVKLRAMLDRLQWSCFEQGAGGDACPVCFMPRENGHTSDCELAALLGD